MKQKYIDLYMDWAARAAELSHAVRLKVGAVIVKDDCVISYGYNGMPAGWDNQCEHKQFCISKDFNGNYFPGVEEEYPFIEYSDEDNTPIGRYRLKTRPEVLHAERNALDKLAKRGGSGGDGALLFTTTAPCLECAKSIYGAGIKEVYYNNEYRSEDGIYFLKKCGVNIVKMSRGDK